MAIHRSSKSTAKASPKAKAMVMKPAGKGKPVAKKPAAKPAAKTAAKPPARTVVNPVAKVTLKPASKAPSKPAAKVVAKAVAKPLPAKPQPVKPAAKAAAPATKSAAKPAAKPGSKTAPKAPVLNAGAAKAKALAEARAAAAAAEAERKRIPRLVPATPGAIRPGAAKVVPTKGKGSNRPPAEVRPIGVLPPESMAKPKTTPTLGRIVIPERSTTSPAANAARMAAGTEVTLTKADLAYFEQRLLKERSRIAGEMGHLESSILKVNPRNPGGLTGDYTFNMADAGTDSMEREISFDIASKEGRLLREIDDALRRLYNGVYGLCESSGKMIARARLEALPWARYTVQEQENIERQQRAGRLAKEDE